MDERIESVLTLLLFQRLHVLTVGSGREGGMDIGRRRSFVTPSDYVRYLETKPTLGRCEPSSTLY